MTMATDNNKPLMRSLGEFVGHIVKGVKTKPGEPAKRTVVRREVEEEEKGDVILRRTTIEEIEYKGGAEPAQQQTDEAAPDDRSEEGAGQDQEPTANSQ
jgi:hypothetical protein